MSMSERISTSSARTNFLRSLRYSSFVKVSARSRPTSRNASSLSLRSKDEVEGSLVFSGSVKSGSVESTLSMVAGRIGSRCGSRCVTHVYIHAPKTPTQSCMCYVRASCSAPPMCRGLLRLNNKRCKMRWEIPTTHGTQERASTYLSASA